MARNRPRGVRLDGARPLHLGVAYYPEHWPEERWPEDVRLMEEAGITVVRLGEFAWSSLEPAPGRFEFAWLQRAVSILADAEMAVVLGTPTAAPPAWLIEAHPDALAVDTTGHRVQFGNRCHYCVNSPEFHAASVRLVDMLASCFGADPGVIGWQVDNEYNRVCYCDRCRELFHDYLARTYDTVEQLNRAWSTRYWSQTYDHWAQIPLPRDPVSGHASELAVAFHNPGLVLAFRRFVTDSYRRFQRLQIDALRPHLPATAWITHNFMEWHNGYDHYLLSEDLDIASWDWYVGMGRHDYLTSGAAHDLVRGFKRRNFWLMETHPGSVNWRPINTVTERGEGRAMAWHAVAHGADAVLYWQWRSALGGQEQYHGTIVDASGLPRPIYEEIRQLGADFGAASSVLDGTRVQAEAAILNSYDSRWSIDVQPHHRDFDYVDHLRHYYRPLASRNIAVDIVSADAALDGYRLVIAPALIVVNARRASELSRFVERGGYLILTVRTGMKDDHNALLPSRQPGPLAALAGIEVEEFFALLDPIPVVADGLTGFAHTWAERLRICDPATDTLAHYGRSNGWLDGGPALTVRRMDQGRVYFFGAWFEDALQDALLAQIAGEAGLRPALATPPGVEAARRTAPDGREVIVLVNHERQSARVSLAWPAWDHLGGKSLDASVELEPYGVALLTRDRG